MSMEIFKPLLEMFIAALGAKYGVALQIFAVLVGVIGFSRSIFKLIPGLIKIYVSATPNPSDDASAEKIENSKWYKTGVLVLDFLFSIKVPPKA